MKLSPFVEKFDNKYENFYENFKLAGQTFSRPVLKKFWVDLNFSSKNKMVFVLIYKGLLKILFGKPSFVDLFSQMSSTP